MDININTNNKWVSWFFIPLAVALALALSFPLCSIVLLIIIDPYHELLTILEPSKYLASNLCHQLTQLYFVCPTSTSTSQWTGQVSFTVRTRLLEDFDRAKWTRVRMGMRVSPVVIPWNLRETLTITSSATPQHPQMSAKSTKWVLTFSTLEVLWTGQVNMDMEATTGETPSTLSTPTQNEKKCSLPPGPLLWRANQIIIKWGSNKHFHYYFIFIWYHQLLTTNNQQLATIYIKYRQNTMISYIFLLDIELR
jgi:hypothetical protein